MTHIFKCSSIEMSGEMMGGPYYQHWRGCKAENHLPLVPYDIHDIYTPDALGSQHVGSTNTEVLMTVWFTEACNIGPLWFVFSFQS